RQADLQQLNFATTEFKVAGNIKADIITADPDHLNGDVFATGLQIVKEGRRINVDTISIHSVATARTDSLKVRSEILSLDVDGDYQLTKVGNAIINQVNKYYSFGTVVPVPDQRIRFKLNIYNSKLLKDFVPTLTTFSPGTITGLIDTQKDSLRLNASFPQVVYGDLKVDSTRLTVSNTNNSLDYALYVKSIQNPTLQLYTSEISGNAANNELALNILLRDSKRKDRYALSGLFNAINKDYRFKMDPKRLLLNYQQWTVNPDNFIQFGESGIIANNFNLSQGSQLLRVNSESQQPNSPLNIELRNFRIETLTSFAETDSTLVGGAINGTATVKDLPSNPKFEANLNVTQLRYKKDNLGDLRIAVNNNTANAFEVNAALSGIHELRVNGFYYTAPQSALDLDLTISKLDLKELESVSGGQIRQGTGTITGQLSVKGSLASPSVIGDIRFNQAGFNIKYVNSYFRVPDETINISGEGIRFNSFTLIDSLNKKAVIDGMVYTKDFRNYRFGLDITTDNFRALNSTEKDNELIYGTVFISTNLKVRGDLNQPEVSGNVNVNEGTKFFFALPADDPAVIEQSGIVQFIDEDAPPFNGKVALNVDSLTRSPMKGMNLSVNVEIDKEAELNVVVDPSNGDALRVKGQGSLNATIDPSGKTSLTGRYELTDGSYNLSVGGLSRKEFKIQPGSTIIWTGEPTSADINITAVYEVNTAAIDLVADQVESMDASVRNTYKQKLPFQVFLYLTGELLKPTIAFKIDLPENERGGTVGYAAYAKLQQVNSNESELNKQVFALLALNRFISENPFQSLAGGTSTSSLARQSVSKLLTEQLNNLASDLIKGVDINLGVNSSEDYSSGTLENRTDLEVGLSKRLLNDRLTISVGSTFGIEGSRPANQSSSNIAGNINVEYLLSADGRYRLRFYRRNETEAVVEGQII
ncbi:MAG: translocation/assembly module TamB, partial [Pedobacter sp.]